MEVTIIGSGNMARAIGTRLVAGGQVLTVIDRDAEKAKNLAEALGSGVKSGLLGESVSGEVVILTLPYMAIFEVLEKFKTQLAGKILVDISNPVDFQTMRMLPPPGTSGAQELAKHLPPSAKLVKAFNTTFSGTLLTGEISGSKLDVFIAGDDDSAKDIIAGIVTDSGMRPLDVGPLANAGYLEGFQLIHMLLQEQLGSGWKSGIKIITS